MSGEYRRAVFITSAENWASADMEDDQHRFGVDVIHDGSSVVSIDGRAIRTPWSSCAAATGVLQALRQLPLMASPFDVLRQVKQRLHCTHLLDLAALAIAAAARGNGQTRYDVALQLSKTDGIDRREGSITRNGAVVDHWLLENHVIRRPEPLSGLELARASRWEADHLRDLAAKDAIFIMRRAELVSGGRLVDLNVFDYAKDMDGLRDVCFTFQSDQIDTARRNMGSTRDFSQAGDLLADLG